MCNKLNEVHIKIHTCYYDDIISIMDIDLDNILLDEKPSEDY